MEIRIARRKKMYEGLRITRVSGKYGGGLVLGLFESGVLPWWLPFRVVIRTSPFMFYLSTRPHYIKRTSHMVVAGRGANRSMRGIWKRYNPLYDPSLHEQEKRRMERTSWI